MNNNKSKKKVSIKKRLVSHFMLVVLISVLIFEILLIGFIKQYYYSNVEEILTNQIKIASDFYERYFSNTSLEENVLDNVDVFWKQTNAQVQIVDESGKILMDSIGVSHDENIQTQDFKDALTGKKGKLVERVKYDDVNTMAISYPLRNEGEIIGVLRFITSLRAVNSVIRNISLIFISIGILVICIAAMVSIFLSNSIIGPIKELTHVAEEMADGNLKIRSKKIFNDEIGKLSDTLNYMADEILKKDQLKNDFISSVSHEIRTPLTSIKGWAVLLSTGVVKEKEMITEGLEIIEKETERLTSMVEELLDFSKFVSGKIKLNKEEINIIEIIKYIQNHMSSRAYGENIEFVVTYEENLPIIHIDTNRMKQVLINVLDNAFKFTSENGKVIFNTKKEENYIIMSIEDNGCGVSEEELPRLTEKFYKGKNSKSQNGIGLSICDEIVTMHNGVLKIESMLNVGTKVYIKIPIK
ncbi:HAMP domain-containing protein [Lutibacter sp. B2]|nr:HAMP domain-containing protein [Lutibacter sp. B2]